MVRLSVLALLTLSVSSVLARPTHHRRNKVCRTESVGSSTVNIAAAETSAPAKATTGKGGKKTDDKKNQDTTSDTTVGGTTGNSTTGGDNSSGGDVPSGATGALKAIFPVSFKESSSWSTAKVVSNAVSLSSGGLKVIKGKFDTPVETFQGKNAIKATFKKGSINPGNANAPAPPMAFYATGPTDLTGDEVVFSYAVFFEDGFAFNQGGKLPGLFGGINDNVAATCSGGRHNPGCWSARIMWRNNGEGELYTYLPPGAGKNGNKCGRKANGVCKSEYGMSIGTGSWTFPTGKWTTVTERLKLNDVGSANGEIEIFINGASVLKVTELTIRTQKEAVCRGIQMQCFFGGHDFKWASPKTQTVHFADISAAIAA